MNLSLSWLAVSSLWWREINRFRRQRSRWLSALTQPLLFWLLIGGGLSASFRPPGAPEGMGYLEFFYPGIIVLVMLFTAIFATIAVVEDRREGFLQGVLVAPISRASIVLGQALGSATLAWLQGVIFLLLAPLAGISLNLAAVVSVAMILACLAFGLTNMGLIIAWRMQSTQGFHAIMNLILMPIWLLSGAFFPPNGAPFWLAWLMRINPLTYGMAALRRCLYSGHADVAAGLPPLLPAVLVLVGFALVAFALVVITAERRA